MKTGDKKTSAAGAAKKGGRTAQAKAASAAKDTAAAPDAAAPEAEAPIEIDLRGLFFVVWRGKWFIALTTCIAIWFGIDYVRDYVPQYKSAVVVRPNTQQPGMRQGLGEGSNSLIAAVVGLNNPGASLLDQFDQIYGSPVVAERLIRDHNMLKIVFEGFWDDERNVWVPPTGWRFELQEKVKAFLGISAWQPPTKDDLADKIREDVKFRGIPGTEMVEISFEHQERNFSHWFLSLVFEEADAVLRESETARTRTRLDYLQRRIAETTVLDYRNALLNLVSLEEKRMMLLETGLPYAVEVVQPLSVPDRPDRPKLARVGVVSVAAGLVLGTVLVMLFAFIRMILRPQPPGRRASGS